MIQRYLSLPNLAAAKRFVHNSFFKLICRGISCGTNILMGMTASLEQKFLKFFFFEIRVEVTRRLNFENRIELSVKLSQVS
jgi:hypothetical protein